MKLQRKRPGWVIKAYWVLLFSLLPGAPLLAQYAVNGNAVNLGGNCFRLTEAINWQNGSVWYLNRVDISQSFDLYFDIFLGCQDINGADGMAFVLQPISTSIGSAGGGMGYQGISPSFVMEIDTWQNPEVNDPSVDHLAIMANGVVDHQSNFNLAGPVAAVPGGNIEDCQVHSLRVTWRADSMIFRAYIDCNLTISYFGNIVQSIFRGNPQVYWGFTSATGGSNNEHRFCLDYISFTEDLKDTSICVGSSVVLSVGSGDSVTWTPTTGLSNPNSFAPVATPQVTTTYIAQVTDVCGQFRYDTVTVVVDTPFTLQLPPDQVLCRGDSLTLSAPVSGGSYLWSDGSSGDTFTATQPGLYWLEATNLCDTQRDSIRLLPQAQPTLTVSPVSCYGSTDGWAAASTTAPPRYNFFWLDSLGNIRRNANTINPQDTITGLWGGRHTLILFDGNGCVDTIPFVVPEPTPFSAQLAFKRDLTCGGTATGTLSATAAGGTPPYQYSVDGVNYQNSGIFNNLPAGTYPVNVKDVRGCDTTFFVTLTEPPPLQLSLLFQRNLTCFGDSSGQIRVSAMGGYPPYLFAYDGINFGTDSSFAALAAGAWPVVVVDDSACADTLQVTLTEPPLLTGSIASQVNVACNGDSSGAVTITAGGGTPPYQFSIDGLNFSSVNTFNGLPAGTYSITLRDDSTCVTDVPVNILEPAPLSGSITAQRNVFCRGDASGSVTVAGSGGTAPYAYALNSGSFRSSGRFDSLTVGNYLVTVQDSLGCSFDVAVSITEPAQDLLLGLDTLINVDCQGNASGEIQVSATGGTSPYQFSNNGRIFGPGSHFTGLSATVYQVIVRDSLRCTDTLTAIVASPTGLYAQITFKRDLACFGDSNGVVTQLGTGGTAPYTYGIDTSNLGSNPTYSTLPAGNYTSYLRDANNCLVSVGFTIWEPPLLTLGIADSTDVGCNGAATGRIVLAPQGGTPGYLYTIDSLSFQPDSIYSGLSSGPYTVTVQDDSGCVAVVSTVLSEPSPLVGSIVDQKNVTCFGDSNAWVLTRASGGVAPYLFALDTLPLGPDTLFDFLTAGSYQVTVQDDSGCLATIQVDITQPDTLLLEVALQKDLTCFGDSSGWLHLRALGGTRPHTFSLANGPFGPDSIFTGLAAGVHLFTVVDDSGCTATLAVDIAEPPPLDVAIVSQTDILCHGDASGAFSLTVNGGTRPYGFSLNGGSFGPDSLFADLMAGLYQVVAVDDSGCTGALSLTLSEPDSLLVSIDVTPVRCFGEMSGGASLQVEGGVVPYDIRWATVPPQNGPQVNNLPAGSYPVRLLDGNGCEVLDTAQVTEPPLLELTLAEAVDAYCDWENGTATVEASGGTPGYQVAWSSVPPQYDLTAIGLAEGSYQVLLTDQNGCEDSLNVDIGNTPPAVPSFYTVPADSPFILLSEAEVQFVNTSIGAIAYLWDFGDRSGSSEENPLHSYLEPGDYEVVLTAYNEFYVCPVEYRHILHIAADGRLFLANAFTPNADGFNDVYYVKGEGIVEMDFAIFDRWGRQIALLRSVEEGWDGRLPNGGSAPEGVYTFVLRATFNSGAKMERSGTITLIR